MSGVEFVSIKDWNAATDRAIKGKSLAQDPRCLYGWGPRKDGPGPGGCDHRFGHACGRPFRHAGRCMEGPAYGDRYRCETAQRPKDWDDKVRAECNG